MAIYVNGRFLLQSLTGVNRFAYELCKAWTALGVPFTICCPPGKIKDCYDTSAFDIVVCGWGKSHLWEQLCLPIWFARLKGEKLLVNFTSLSPIFVRKKIMTIHDLAFLVNPHWYARSYVLLYKFLTPWCAATSQKILTVSEFSKKEIIRLLSVKKEKITVVYNAVSANFLQGSPTASLSNKQNCPYILAVSSIDPRKNFATLLKAFTYLKENDVKLYIIGGQAGIYSTSVKELSKEIPQEKIKWLGRVTDTELRQYYAGALCFIYPSFYEGFGIPPLEAMACGTPVIASAIPAIQEVCQDAALYINPYDAKDIADKINLLIHNVDLQNDLIKKGSERYLQFDWKQSAKHLIDEISHD